MTRRRRHCLALASQASSEAISGLPRSPEVPVFPLLLFVALLLIPRIAAAQHAEAPRTIADSIYGLAVDSTGRTTGSRAAESPAEGPSPTGVRLTLSRRYRGPPPTPTTSTASSRRRWTPAT